MAYRGFTLELIGDSGSGKTTQIGELCKHVFKTRKQRSVLYSCDRGGFDSITALVRADLLTVRELGPVDDPWIWVNGAVSGDELPVDTGLVAFDSGTSMADNLLTACHNSPFQIGQQRTQKFTVARPVGQGSGGTTVAKGLEIGINNEAHYGVVQGFMLEAIRKSTWLTLRGIDVVWTFALWRGEAQDKSLILGPKVAGRALTPFLPKEFRYTFRIASMPQDGAPPLHRLYLSEHPELAGLGHSFGNARYPLGATPLPAFVEPASVPEALRLIDAGQEEADRLLQEELN